MMDQKDILGQSLHAKKKNSESKDTKPTGKKHTLEAYSYVKPTVSNLNVNLECNFL